MHSAARGMLLLLANQQGTIVGKPYLLACWPSSGAACILTSALASHALCHAGEHNPVEDARAAMDLALLKFERGPAYAAGGGERGDKLAEVLNDAGRWAEAAGWINC